MKRGFTFLEVVTVIVIIGVLVKLGFNQYVMAVERSRAAEAKTILGQLRSAEARYYQNFKTYSGYNAATHNLGVSAPTDCSQTTHYFSYDCVAASGECTATRCEGVAGKQPGFSSAGYSIALTVSGIWTNAGGY